ncbi:hypothetical protein D3C72_387890 [compost metagenome]
MRAVALIHFCIFRLITNRGLQRVIRIDKRLNRIEHWLVVFNHRQRFRAAFIRFGQIQRNAFWRISNRVAATGNFNPVNFDHRIGCCNLLSHRIAGCCRIVAHVFSQFGVIRGDGHFIRCAAVTRGQRQIIAVVIRFNDTGGHAALFGVNRVTNIREARFIAGQRHCQWIFLTRLRDRQGARAHAAITEIGIFAGHFRAEQGL